MSAKQHADTLTNKELFLQHFIATGNIAGACRLSGIGRRTVYHWLEDPSFKVLFKEAEADAVDTLEQEARRRALLGIERPVFHAGKQVGKIREYSDTLLIFLLKGKRPETYRERFDHHISPNLGALSVDELEQWERLMTKVSVSKPA